MCSLIDIITLAKHAEIPSQLQLSIKGERRGSGLKQDLVPCYCSQKNILKAVWPCVTMTCA